MRYRLATLKPERWSHAFLASYMSSYTTYAVPRVSFVVPLQKEARKLSHKRFLASWSCAGWPGGPRRGSRLGSALLSLLWAPGSHSDLSDGPVFPKDVVHLIGRDVEGQVAHKESPAAVRWAADPWARSPRPYRSLRHYYPASPAQGLTC
jgi:hypothetical protein